MEDLSDDGSVLKKQSMDFLWQLNALVLDLEVSAERSAGIFHYACFVLGASSRRKLRGCANIVLRIEQQ